MVVLLGSIGAASVTESLQSEESSVETKELIELEISSEGRLENRRQCDRRDVVRFISPAFSDMSRRSDSPPVIVGSLPTLPPRHNGCGSHLRI